MRKRAFDPCDWELFVELCALLSEGRPTSLAEVRQGLCHRLGRNVEVLTRVLDRFESVLQVPKGALVDRKALRITEHGIKLHELFRDLQQRYQHGLGTVRRHGRTCVRVGVPTTLGTYVLPLVLCWSRFLERHLDIDLRIIVRERGGWNDLLLGEPQIDFLFTREWQYGLRLAGEPLRSIPRVLLAPRMPGFEEFADVAAGRGKFRKAMLSRHTVFFVPSSLDPPMDVDRWLPVARHSGHQVQLNYNSMVRSWVRAGLGVGVTHELPRALEERDAALMSRIVLTDFPMELRLGLYYPLRPGGTERRPLCEPAQDLCDAIRQFCATQWDRGGE
jgi:DNA-binding transcriptional LysR family regulator